MFNNSVCFEKLIKMLASEIGNFIDRSGFALYKNRNVTAQTHSENNRYQEERIK